MHQAEDAAHDRDADEEQDMAVAGGVAISCRKYLKIDAQPVPRRCAAG
jgi:hypothetical protein